MYLSPTTGQITSKSISKVVLNIWYILQLRKIFCGILMAFQCKLKVTFYFNTRINCYTRSVDKINDKIHSFKIIGVCQFIDIHVYEYMRRQNINTWQNEEWNTPLFLFKSVTMIMADIKKLTIMTLQHGDKICDCNTCEPYSSSVHLHVLSCLPLLSL